MSDTGFHNYQSYLSGDQSALEDLVRTYSDALTRYAYCYLSDSAAAEDVMEETIATLIVKRRHFHDGAHFHAYLYKVARNKSIDYLRRRQKQISLEDIEELLADDNPEESVMRNERNRTLYICMQKLPAQYREALYLSYMEDFSTEEVCRIMRKNTKQVYNLLSRAKAALKEIFVKEGITYENI